MICSFNGFTQFYSQKLYTKKDGLKDNSILDLIQTKDGHLWMINGGELCQFDGRDFNFFSLKNDIKDLGWDDSPINLIELENGELMFRNTQFCTFNTNAKLFNYYGSPPDDATKAYSENGDHIGFRSPLSFEFDNLGNVFYPNYTGLYVLTKDSSFKLLDSNQYNGFIETYTTSNNKLWVATKDTIYHYKSNHLTKFSLPIANKIISFHPRVIYQDSNGLLYFNNAYEKRPILYLFNPKKTAIDTFDFGQISPYSFNNYTNFIVRKKDLLYVLTTGKLTIYNLKNKKVHKSINVNRKYNRLELGENGYVYAYSSSAILGTFHIINNKHNSIELTFPSSIIKEFLVDKDNNIWLATAYGLIRFSPSQLNLLGGKLYTNPIFDINTKSTLYNWRFNLELDYLNGVWFINNYKYLSKAYNPKLPHTLYRYSYDNEHYDKILSSKGEIKIVWDKINKCMYVGEGKNIYRWEEKNGLKKLAISNNNVFDFANERTHIIVKNGILFLSNEKLQKIYLLDGNTLKLVGNNTKFINNSRQGPMIFTSYEDPPKLYYFNEEKLKSELFARLDSSSISYNAIFDEYNGKWTFGYKDELVIYSNKNSTYKKKHAYQSSGFGNYDLNTIADSRGNIWFSTDMGVNRICFKNDSISSKLYNKTDGLLSTVINDMYIDDNDVLWVATNVGLNRIDTKSIDGKGVNSITHYTEAEGIRDGNCMKFFERNHKLFVFTPKGYFQIKESINLTNNIAPQAYFKSIFYSLNDHEEVYIRTSNSDSVYNFKNPFNPIKIDYNAIKFNNTEKLFYNVILYKNNELLYGTKKDLDWVELENITYQNLDPGKYRLELSSKIGKHGLPSPPTILKFNILPAWWQTLWAKGVYILIVLAVIYLLYKWRTNNLIKKQEKLEEDIKNATHEIREQRDEILDSINYAKRIQSAILPPNKIVKEYLKNSFILYKPKDIVAGDFYWLEHKEDTIFFAAADCTGHGVPGAMVSVVCNNALNRAIKEHKLTEPGKILDKTREIVISEFEKSEEDVKDGMDIALCSLQDMTLKYAGANNPLWIIRNGEIIETKANKQPIGKYDNLTPFTTHSFNLEKGDTFYVFSDGYVDQFGGAKGKKYKASAFRKLLLSIQDKNMEAQKTIINNTFENWKGNLEQIDDVCVIGVRL